MLYSHLSPAHQASEAARASHNISTVFKRLHSNNCTHSLCPLTKLEPSRLSRKFAVWLEVWSRPLVGSLLNRQNNFSITFRRACLEGGTYVVHFPLHDM
jgi:hypothetical protein